jgi:uncharacterized protein YkwD
MLGPPVAHAQQFEIPASAKAAIIDATNTYRQSKGLATLSESEDASREAPCASGRNRRDMSVL